MAACTYHKPVSTNSPPQARQPHQARALGHDELTPRVPGVPCGGVE